MNDTARTTARISAARARRRTGNGERPATRRTAEQKARNRDIASRLRKSGRIAALGGDIADMAEQGFMLALSADEGYEHINGELTAIDRAAREETVLMSESPRLLDDAAGATAELRMQHRESGRAIMRELRVHPGMFEEVQQAERTASLAQEAIGAYRTTLKETGKLVKSLAALSETLDVASLNAALEAGKVEAETVLVPLSEQARALSSDWSGMVERFTAIVAEQKRIAGDVSGKCGETSDRIRALGAMVKGVQTSFDDLGAERDTVLASIDRLDGQIAACAGAFRDCRVEGTAVITDDTGMQAQLNAIFDADNRFCDAIDNLAEYVENVSRAAADFSEGSACSANLVDAAERLLGHLPEISVLAGPVADELAAFEGTIAVCAEDIRKPGSGFDTLDSACDAAGRTVDTLNEAYRSLDGSMGASLEVLRQAVREFGNLYDEQRGAETSYETLRDGIDSLARFEGRFAMCASRLETLTAISGIEARNAGESAGGFSVIPAHFAGIAAELSAAAAETGRIADALARSLAEVVRVVRNYGWRERMLYARSFAAALEDAVTTTHDVTLDTCSRIGTALADCRTAVRDARTAASIDARLIAMADMIGSARESVGARRKILADMADATERLAEYADSVAVEIE